MPHLTLRDAKRINPWGVVLSIEQNQFGLWFAVVGGKQSGRFHSAERAWRAAESMGREHARHAATRRIVFAAMRRALGRDPIPMDFHPRMRGMAAVHNFIEANRRTRALRRRMELAVQA
jgi:hypothetical protein